MKKAVIYTRVSTDEQKENGFSLQDQERRLRMECDRRGYTIIAHYQDDHSAKDFNRPMFQAFLSDLKLKRIAKPDVFLCVKPDRFTRNHVDGMLMVGDFMKMGIEYETLEGHVDLNSPQNLIPFAMQMLLAEVDNKVRGENTKRGMRQAAREGRFPWRAPIGYVNDPATKLVLIDEKRAPAIKFAFETYAKGTYSVEQVREMLKERGVTTSKQNLINVLRNIFYTGKVKIDAWKEKNEPEEIVNGLHEPLIAEDVYQTCLDLLNGKKKKLSRLSTRQEHLPLRGRLQCARCGGKLTGSNSKSRNGSLHSYYHCQKGCKERFRADEANSIFIQYLQDYAISDEAQELYLKILADVFKANDAELTRERQRIDKQAEDLNRRIESLNDKYFDGLIDDQTYRESKKRYEGAKSELATAHFNLQPEGAAFKAHMQFSAFCSHNLGAFYQKADYEGKQQIVGSIFPDNLVFEEKKYRTTRINQAIELICSIDKAFKEGGNKKAIISDGLSTLAPPVGLEPTTL